MAYHPWSCGAAIVLHACRHRSYKEGPADLDTMRGVLRASCSEAYLCPHRLERGAFELEASYHAQGRPGALLRTTSIWLPTMEKGWVKISSQLTQGRQAWSASIRGVVSTLRWLPDVQINSKYPLVYRVMAICTTVMVPLRNNTRCRNYYRLYTSEKCYSFVG